MVGGAASALFLLDVKGRILLWRDYRGDISAGQAERFFTKLVQTEEEVLGQGPVVEEKGVTYMCVRLARFENDWTISFVPPDGSFDLMTYRLSIQVKPLIWVEGQVEKYSKSRVEIMIKARSQFKERSYATSVEIDLPLPPDATNPNIWTSMRTAKYTPENDAMLWTIKSFPGNKVSYLKIIEKSGYQALPLV